MRQALQSSGQGEHRAWVWLCSSENRGEEVHADFWEGELEGGRRAAARSGRVFAACAGQEE